MREQPALIRDRSLGVRIRRISAAIVLGPFLGLLLLWGLASPARASGGYQLEQREGASHSRLTLSPSGLSLQMLAPLRSGGHAARGRAKPVLEVAVRYSDSRLLLVDNERKRYELLSLASALSTYAKEVAALARAGPSAKLPPAPPVKTGHARSQPAVPAARITRLSLTAQIGPIQARAYLLRQGTLRERLWYSTALPSPPARVRGLLTQALGSSAAGALGRALRAHAAQIPLRIDVAGRRGWHAVLRTVRVARVSVAGPSLAPPRGYSRQSVAAPPGVRARVADVPGAPIRCGILISDPINCTIGTVGPVSEHPAIWAFYWGRHFSEHLDFVSSINHALENMVGDQFADGESKNFWGGLDQYGVDQGKFLGYEIVNDKPDSSVGSWNFFDVAGFVFTHRFGSDAPNYWWRLSGEDPIFAIFVDQSEVASSGWGGYHAFTPTEGILFSFLVHPAMPWLIVKVPGLDSLTHERDSPAYREAVDTTSERASHEFVEAATDPYPFLSWADPLKQPIWEEGELGDICAQGSSYPWGKHTRIIDFGTAVEPYWSNAAEACVPDARPSAQIVFPTGPETHGWHSPVTFIAQTHDVFEGGPSPDFRIRWDSDKDGQGIGYGHIFTTSALSVGTHQIRATVTDSAGGTRVTAPVTVTVVLHPPTVKISQPSEGASFGSDQTVTYRGSAFDPADGDIGSSAVWSVDGTPVGTGATTFLYRIPTEGAHAVTLSATDSGGASASASIKVNVGPPTGKPTVRITSPENGQGFSPGEVITFSAVAEGLEGATVPNSGYSWSDDKDGFLGTGQTVMHTLSGFECGGIETHHVTVTATDTFSRKASDTIEVFDGQIC